MLRDLSQDFRHGLRGLRRTPGFTILVVLTLALGIGSNTAIFGLVNDVLLRSLPVAQPQRLVLLSDGLFSGVTGGLPGDGRVNAYSVPLYRHLRERDQLFAGLAAQEANRTPAIVRWEGSASHAHDSANGRLVSANYFAVIGVGAERGRLFLPEDESAPGVNPVVVLSHGYWQRRFGGNASVLGARLDINGRSYTVVGISAAGFSGTRVGEVTDLWVPITMQAAFQRDDDASGEHGISWLVLFGRLKPGVTRQQAEAGLNVSLKQYTAALPKYRPQDGRGPFIQLQDGASGVSLFRETFGGPLLALMGGVGLLLLIVCLNVSHLLLARAVNRQREMSIRTALGASPWRLARQLLAEGSLLALLGGVGAVLVGRWLGDGLRAIAPGASGLPEPGGADPRVAGFTALLALATALLLGLVPAWQAAGVNLQEALRSSAHSLTASGSRRRITRLLLASQVALSMVLLVGAGLLGGSLMKLRRADKGFQEEHLLLVDLIPRFTGADPQQALALYDDIIRRVQAVPGVRSASMSVGTGRVVGAMTTGFQVAVAGSDRYRTTLVGTVTPDFFQTMGMKILRGRSLERTDHHGAARVGVISESLAARLFGGEDAVGKRLSLDDGAGPNPILEIVGVVRDARTNDLREAAPALFRPVAQSPSYLRGLQVRTTGDPTSIAHEVRQAVQAAHPGLPVVAVRTMTSRVDMLLKQERLLAMLSTAFGLAALFLICLGLYGVISQWAAQRIREIGLRMALGATTSTVRWMVMRQALGLVLAGVLVALPAALAGAQLLRGMLYGLEPANPLILGGSVAALFAVAAVAAYLPARRASRIDPMNALRAG